MNTTPENGTPPATSAGTPLDAGADAASPLMYDAILRAALALLAPEQLAEVIANRVIIEQAKGMVMMVDGIDADSAFDVLRRQSQSSNVKLGVIAEQLCGDLLELAGGEQMALWSACDAAVRTAHERVAPARGTSSARSRRCSLTAHASRY